MILRGRPISGEEAADWGLVVECVAEDALDSAVGSVASEFAAAATVSVGLAKSLLHANVDLHLGAALQNEAMSEEVAVRSEDFKEGMRAFVQKRKPSYSGW
jgi:2-(1,2-epoxy-1,2-dihydrophenyl)acetyl-CoA isomerase